jgi:hypothetical protein
LIPAQCSCRWPRGKREHPATSLLQTGNRTFGNHSNRTLIPNFLCLDLKKVRP